MTTLINASTPAGERVKIESLLNELPQESNYPYWGVVCDITERIEQQFPEQRVLIDELNRMSSRVPQRGVQRWNAIEHIPSLDRIDVVSGCTWLVYMVELD